MNLDVLATPRSPTALAGALGATVVGGAVVGLVLGVGIAALGVFVPLAVIAGVGAFVLVQRPGLTFALLVASVILFEDTTGALLTVEQWYEGLPGVFLGPTDLLLVVLVAGVAIEIGRDHDAERLLGPFTGPLLVLAAATLAGVVVGRSAGAGTLAIFPQVRPLIFFVIFVPVAGYVLAKQQRWRTALQVAAVLIPVKAAIGIATRLYGGELSPGQSPVTFYEPTMNILMVVFLLTLLAAAIRRVHLPRWIWLSSPVVALSLLLSFRRSFWIALVLGLVIVGFLAAGRRSRPVVVLLLLAIGLSLWTVMSVGGSTDSTNPIIDRAQSLSPSRLNATSGDRYRLEEQRNVVAEVKAHPVEGLGLGIPWTQRYAVSELHPGGRYYTHVTPLWYWLKLGILGVVAYVWLAGAAITVAHHRFRRAGDPLVRVVGLAVAAGWIGLLVAELTGPFTGIDFRLTIAVGTVLGWLTATGGLPGERQSDAVPLPSTVASARR